MVFFDMKSRDNVNTTRFVGALRPLLARSGYPGQDASFYNNPMVMICATVNNFLWVWTNLCYRECFCKTNIWEELHFEFSRQNLNRNVHSPSLWWWLITQPRPIWKKAPPGLQRPSRTDSGISGVLYWPKPSGPHLGPDPRPPIPHK